ncbi:MAG: hypothetical protein II934_00155 [Prevotella sp.]|nr:hypothetical protein [Prevotella sp.]
MRQKRTKICLEDGELSFFYKILYQYESDSHHKGYDLRYLSKELRSMINLKGKQTNITTPKTKNTLFYTGNTVIADFLRHVRNAFAHCNIGSSKNSLTFSFYDEYQGKCTMDGSMDKAIFYRLIKEINNTRKL